jgi:hypothetical protein
MPINFIQEPSGAALNSIQHIFIFVINGFAHVDGKPMDAFF